MCDIPNHSGHAAKTAGNAVKTIHVVIRKKSDAATPNNTDNITCLFIPQ